MNLQLDNVITDITGKTGIAIIRDIVAGQRDRKVLAKHRDPNCKNSEEIIEKSLKGNYCDEHVFQLEQSLELYAIALKNFVFLAKFKVMFFEHQDSRENLLTVSGDPIAKGFR